MSQILSGCAVRAMQQVEMQREEAERIATNVVQRVCELPDYTSPDDQPDLLMCTVDQLHLCVMRALGQDV